jgi:FK506-binding protein 2
MGIDGVPTPEKILYKAAEAEEKVGQKVARAIGEAAQVIKTMLADTDDVQEHNEL